MKEMVDPKELYELTNKVKSGIGTKEDRDRLMNLLYLNGSISADQYSNYLKKENTDELVQTALIVATVVVAGLVLAKLLGD